MAALRILAAGGMFVFAIMLLFATPMFGEQLADANATIDTSAAGANISGGDEAAGDVPEIAQDYDLLFVYVLFAVVLLFSFGAIAVAAEAMAG